MSAERELHRLIDNLLSDDAVRALAAYRRLVDDQLPWLERRAVVLARRQQMTWAGIGRVLGRTRQATRQKFDRAFRADELTAPATMTRHGDAYQQDLEASIDRARRELRLQQMEDDDGVVAW